MGTPDLSEVLSLKLIRKQVIFFVIYEVQSSDLKYSNRVAISINPYFHFFLNDKLRKHLKTDEFNEQTRILINFMHLILIHVLTSILLYSNELFHMLLFRFKGETPRAKYNNKVKVYKPDF